MVDTTEQLALGLESSSIGLGSSGEEMAAGSLLFDARANSSRDVSLFTRVSLLL